MSENQKQRITVDIRDITGARLECRSTEHPAPASLQIQGNAFTAENLAWFIVNHVHKENGSLSDVQADSTTLCTVLTKFLTEDLPQLSEITERHKLTFEFEIKPQDH